jgi:hypothetical protein
MCVRGDSADRLLGIRRNPLNGLLGQGSDAIRGRVSQRSYPVSSIVSDWAHSLCSRLGQRSQPIRCGMGER